MPALPLLLILTCAGLFTLSSRPAVVASMCVLLLLPGWVVFPGRLRAIQHYASGMQASYVPLATMLDRTLPPDASIATGDAGALAYYSNRPVIDILGLNDHHIARQPGRFSDSKRDSAYVLGRSPAVIILLSSSQTAGHWKTPVDADLASQAEFQARYEILGTWTLLPDYYLFAYRLKGTGR